MLRNVLRRLAGRPRPPRRDDFDWSVYHREYRAQLEEISRLHTQRLEAGDARFEGGRILLRQGLLPLHPNHACIYETVHALAPASVIEIGCGGGDHIRNLGLLFPRLELSGYDRSSEQLALLAERSPWLSSKVRVLDVTGELPAGLQPAELVFTQAVVMHIHDGGGHLRALSNMFRLATRYVVLMENWRSHPFLEDLRRLSAAGQLAWPAPHFYVRRFAGKPRLMLVSSETLGEEPLRDYRQLLEAMDPA